jgi:hypothetical protein
LPTTEPTIFLLEKRGGRMTDVNNSKIQALFVPEKKHFGEKTKSTLLLRYHGKCVREKTILIKPLIG